MSSASGDNGPGEVRKFKMKTNFLATRISEFTLVSYKRIMNNISLFQ